MVDAHERSGRRNPEYVAVYGSLMSGQGFQRFLGVQDKLKRVGACRIPGDLYAVAEYPGLVKGEGSVEGELYEVVDASAWAALDHYEECDLERPSESLFVRRKVVLLSPPEMSCWVYYYNRSVSGRDPIRGMNWREYQFSRKLRL